MEFHENQKNMQLLVVCIRNIFLVKSQMDVTNEILMLYAVNRSISLLQ